VGTFFLDLFCGGIMSCFSAETMVGANVGGSKNRKGPRTRELWKKVCNSRKTGRQRISESLYSPQKLWTFTRALAPPFIGRRRDFYILRIPSNLRNIPSVNMYTNVFYISWFTELISYIYKSAISSHFKPGLLRWRLWLGSFLILESLIIENHRSLWLSNQDFTRFPNFTDSWFQNFADSLFQNFTGSWFQNFTDFNHPEIDSRFAHRSQIRLLFSHFTWRPEKHLRLIRISS
jgi:hypothetical protein